MAVVQLLSHVWLFATPWTAECQASLSFTISQNLFKLTSTESGSHPTLILYHPLLLLPSIFPSVRVFSSESTLGIRWPKYWSFSFSISLTNAYSELISFRTGFLCGAAGQEFGCNAGDLGLIPGLGRFPGKGKGYSLQYSGLENFMNCIVHGVAKSQTWLSDFYFHFL